MRVTPPKPLEPARTGRHAAVATSIWTLILLWTFERQAIAKVGGRRYGRQPLSVGNNIADRLSLRRARQDLIAPGIARALLRLDIAAARCLLEWSVRRVGGNSGSASWLGMV